MSETGCCVILGAGASHGYDEDLDEEARPPLTTALLTCPRGRALLMEARYSELRELVEEVPTGAALGRSARDIEDLAGSLVAELRALDSRIDALGPQHSDLHSRRQTVSRGLGEAYFYLFELLGSYAKEYVGRADNYRRLAEWTKTHSAAVVSLNYDGLFEQALLCAGVSYFYPGLQPPLGLPLAKVHGSVLWANPMNPMKGGFAFEEEGLDDQIRQISGILFSNLWRIEPLRILDAAQPLALSLRTLVRSGFDYDHPGIVPPLGRYKYYEQVPGVLEAWEVARAAVQSASEVVFVGTSVRQQDERLCDLLTLQVRPTTLLAVAGGYRSLKPRLDLLLGWTRHREVRHFDSFREWAVTL